MSVAPTLVSYLIRLPYSISLAFPFDSNPTTTSWALFHGAISVTPLQSSFAEPPSESFRFGSERETSEVVEGEMRGQWKDLGEGKSGL